MKHVKKRDFLLGLVQIISVLFAVGFIIISLYVGLIKPYFEMFG